MAVPPPADPPGPQPPLSRQRTDRTGPKRAPQPHPRPGTHARGEAATCQPVNRIDLPGRGLRLRPVVHVEDMPTSVAFYRRLGAEIVHGAPDGDWVLIQLGTTQVDLITRPPRAERGECTVELNLAAEEPLERLRDRFVRSSDGDESGNPVAEFATHPDLGEHLEVRTPDGLLIKISQLDPDL